MTHLSSGTESRGGQGDAAPWLTPPKANSAKNMQIFKYDKKNKVR